MDQRIARSDPSHCSQPGVHWDRSAGGASPPSLSFSSQTPIIRICDPQSRVDILPGNLFNPLKPSFLLPQDQIFQNCRNTIHANGLKVSLSILNLSKKTIIFLFSLVRFWKIIYSPMIPVDAGDTWAAGSGIGPDSKWSCWMWPQSIKREHQACVTPGKAPGILRKDILTVSGQDKG